MRPRVYSRAVCAMLVGIGVSSACVAQTFIEHRPNQSSSWTSMGTTLLGPADIYVINSPAQGEWRIRAGSTVDMPQIYFKAANGVAVNFSVGEGSNLPSTSTAQGVTGRDWGGFITTGDSVKLQVSIRRDLLGRVARVTDNGAPSARSHPASLTTGVLCYRLDIGGDILPSQYDSGSAEVIVREHSSSSSIGAVLCQDAFDTLRITAGRVAGMTCSGKLLGSVIGRSFNDITVTGNMGLHSDFGDGSDVAAQILAPDGIDMITAANINADIKLANIVGSNFNSRLTSVTVNGTPGNLNGTVNTRVFNTSGDVVTVNGSLNGKITCTVASGDSSSGMLLSNQRINIKGSLGSAAELNFEATNGLDGQVIVNQGGSSGVWTSGATVKVGLGGSQQTLSGPTYSTLSSQIGGGAVGLAPFRLHQQDCSPPNNFTTFTSSTMVLESEFNGSSNPQVHIRHYGPIQRNAASWNAAVKIECRPLDTQECDSWADASGGFTVTGPGDVGWTQARVIGIARNGSTQVRPGVYRVVLRYPPDAAKVQSKDVIGNPGVIWPEMCNGVGQEDWFAEAYVFTVGPDCDADGHDDRDPSFPPNTSAPNCQSNCSVADFNLNHTVTVQDLFDFLSAYFAACLTASSPPSAPCYQSADISGDSTIGVQDIFDYLHEWFNCQ